MSHLADSVPTTPPIHCVKTSLILQNQVNWGTAHSLAVLRVMHFSSVFDLLFHSTTSAFWPHERTSSSLSKWKWKDISRHTEFQIAVLSHRGEDSFMPLDAPKLVHPLQSHFIMHHAPNHEKLIQIGHHRMKVNPCFLMPLPLEILLLYGLYI